MEWAAQHENRFIQSPGTYPRTSVQRIRATWVSGCATTASHTRAHTSARGAPHTRTTYNTRTTLIPRSLSLSYMSFAPALPLSCGVQRTHMCVHVCVRVCARTSVHVFICARAHTYATYSSVRGYVGVLCMQKTLEMEIGNANAAPCIPRDHLCAPYSRPIVRQAAADINSTRD